MSNTRILAVDDDEQLLQVYRDILLPKEQQRSKLDLFMDEEAVTPVEAQEQGYEVVTASQGVDAVALIRQSLSENRPFAAAFVDIRMPPGIDGLETAKQIRDLDDRVYIIFVTAYSDRSVDEIQETVKHDVLLTRKPLTRDEVLQLARNACNSWAQDQNLEQMQQSLERKVEEHAMARWAMENLVSSASVGLVVCTEKGMVTSINPAAAAMAAMEEEDLLGEPLGALFAEGEIEGIITKAAYQGPQRNMPITLKKADGGVSQLLVSASSMQDAPGLEEVQQGGGGHSIVLVWNEQSSPA
ncbi:response regulator [Magnetococcus sp. PR-3]|uniref:response regulator n=1 Tax=Magnetococcus sp. PR-3 TaxID=3120355 RepID=UPI002FCE059B